MNVRMMNDVMMYGLLLGFLAQPATSNIGIVVGVILGVVIVALGVVLVIVLGYYLYRRLPGSHDRYVRRGRGSWNRCSGKN